jgi:hypothetical protein
MNDAIIQVASTIAFELGVSACDSARVSGWSTSHRIPDESSILTYVTMGPLHGYHRRLTWAGAVAVRSSHCRESSAHAAGRARTLKRLMASKARCLKSEELGECHQAIDGVGRVLSTASEN